MRFEIKRHYSKREAIEITEYKLSTLYEKIGLRKIRCGKQGIPLEDIIGLLKRRLDIFKRAKGVTCFRKNRSARLERRYKKLSGGLYSIISENQHVDYQLRVREFLINSGMDWDLEERIISLTEEGDIRYYNEEPILKKGPVFELKLDSSYLARKELIILTGLPSKDIYYFLGVKKLRKNNMLEKLKKIRFGNTFYWKFDKVLIKYLKFCMEFRRKREEKRAKRLEFTKKGIVMELTEEGETGTLRLTKIPPKKEGMISYFEFRRNLRKKYPEIIDYLRMVALTSFTEKLKISQEKIKRFWYEGLQYAYIPEEVSKLLEDVVVQDWREYRKKLFLNKKEEESVVDLENGKKIFVRNSDLRKILSPEK